MQHQITGTVREGAQGARGVGRTPTAWVQAAHGIKEKADVQASEKTLQRSRRQESDSLQSTALLSVLEPLHSRVRMAGLLVVVNGIVGRR